MEPGTDTVSIARRLLEQAPDAMIFAGVDGRIVTWNAAAAAMFGHTPSDALGQSLDLVIPEQFREAHWKGYHGAVAAGETKYRGQQLPTRAVNAAGEAFYVELSFAIVRDEAGAVVGALACARDINERFERDRASRRRLRELEQELEALRSGGEPGPQHA